MSSVGTRTVTTPALVLRRTDYGEGHRMVLLATLALGTVSAIARHARRSTRRFGGALELFTVLEADLERRGENGPWVLARTRVLGFHDGFVADMGRYAAGSYAVELYRLLVTRDLADAEAFSWLVAFLERWERRLPDPAEMAVEEIALLGVLGHAPRFDRCVTCGRRAPQRSWSHFDHTAGGIVCRRCGGEGTRVGSRLRAFLLAASEGRDGTEAGGDLHARALAEADILRRCLDLFVRALADREPRSMRSLRKAWGL